MTRGSCSSHLVVIYDLAKQVVISRNSWNQGDEVAKGEHEGVVREDGRAVGEQVDERVFSAGAKRR